MERIIPMFIFFLLAGLAGEAGADTVYLKNGRSIEGLIDKEKEGDIWLDVGFGAVKFRMREIERIERSSPDEVSRIREEWKRQRKLEKERWLKREKESEEARRRKEFEPKTVEFSKDSEEIVINALLNKKVKASLLLDTGASLVLLSSRIAERLGIEARRGGVEETIKLEMADGRKIDARFIVLDSVDVQGVEAKDVGAVVMSEETRMDRDGLLGMSFLNKFNFQIDAVNKKLILQKRE